MFELQGLAEVVLKSMDEGVLVTDDQGKIVLANVALERLFSVTEPEIMGKTIRLGLRNNEIADLVVEVAKTGKAVEREINIIFPVEKDFLALASPVQREGGGVVCVLHDVTELRRLERYRSEFLANISHELKTPLTAIRNYVETLIGGALRDEEHNLEFLNKIDKHSIGLSSLIDDILELSRLESKKEIGQLARLDLKAVIGHAVETVAGGAKKKNIHIEKACEGKDLFIQGLSDHVYRAVLNLLGNAINYTNEGGRVEISCIKEKERVKIAVKDSGIGIPEEHLPRIFERFYRVDKARSRELGGTGLGLAIVKHVMNVHNGSVSVESREGQGSTFTLIFPA